MKFSLKEIAAHLPWEELTALYEAAIKAGAKPAQAAKEIAQIIDEMVDFRELVKGPVGAALEAIDFEVIRSLIRLGLVLPRKVREAQV